MFPCSYCDKKRKTESIYFEVPVLVGSLEVHSGTTSGSPSLGWPPSRELPIIQDPSLASLLIYFFVYSFEESLPGRVPRETETEREPTHLLIEETPFQLRCWLTGKLQRQTLNRSKLKGVGSEYWEKTQNPKPKKFFQAYYYNKID
jgi:hypothetical protein